MASSVIIVLRNSQQSDRDTKEILTPQKSLRLVIQYTHVFYFIKHAYTSRLDTFTRKNKQTNKIFSCNLHDFIKKKNITTKIQRISPWCSAADSSINSRHNNFTFSHVLIFQSIRRFVAICKRKQICFCKMVTFFGNIVYSYSYLLLKGLRVSSIVRERRQREE